MTNRLDTLLSKIKAENMDGMFITSQANVFYFSNYYTDPHERVIGVYVSTNRDPILIVPAMEIDDAKASGWRFDIIGYHDHENPWELFSNALHKSNQLPSALGVEFDSITLTRHQEIKSILPNTSLVDGGKIISELRMIKNDEEHALLKEAGELADFGVETGVKAIKEGITELELIAEIEYKLKKQGVDGMSFSTMALSGAKTASPHGTPGKKAIAKGDLVLFDLGVIHEGYCSDTTRTVAFHSITDEQKKIYETVQKAEQLAMDASKIGISVGNIDLAARNHIDSMGYGEYFTHRIGHGLGIETHEFPSMHSQNELKLEKGMCYTIEPGIYVPNTGGVRIEDMIFMTDNGAKTLTTFPKDLQLID